MIPDLLRGAADAIEASGWCQRKDIDPGTGALCANGAMRVAVGHTTYTNVFGENRLAVPTDWSVEHAQATGRQLASAHAVLNEYLEAVHGYAQTAEPYRTILPSVMRFNDQVATSGSAVAGVMRAAAEWVESHPERELAAVEESARNNYLFPQAVVAPSLAGASV